MVNYQKDSLASHSDSINNILDRIRAENDSLFKIDHLHRVEIDGLKNRLKTALNDMFDEMTEDAHYEALQFMFFTTDSLVYPFSGEQIKAIHIDLVEGMYKDSIITEYELNEEILINHNWDAIRRVMWNYVGIVRSVKRLQLAKTRMESIFKEIDQHYHDFLVTPIMVELRNIALISLLIIQSAQQRKESRGLHYITDFKEKDEVGRQTVFQRKKGGEKWEIENIEEEYNG